ncbi:MAG: pilus assembly PilX N-terminal domain-containing protein, partial [Patescibacteria group bacterium]
MISNFKFKISNSDRGVSLVIAFLIMTIILAVVLSSTTILVSQIKIISSIGNSVASLYAAETGVEQVLYIDRHQIPEGATRGFCNTCSACNAYGCNSCEAFSLLDPPNNGCSVSNCTGCRIKFNSGNSLSDRNYVIDANITSLSPLNSLLILNIKS